MPAPYRSNHAGWQHLVLLATLTVSPSAAASDRTADARLPTVEVHAPAPIPDTIDPSPGTLAPARVIEADALAEADRLDEAFTETGWATWSAANSMGMAQGLNVRGFVFSDQNSTQLQASRALINGHADIAWRFMRDPATLESARLLGGTDATLTGAGGPGGTLHMLTKSPSGQRNTQLTTRFASDGTRRLVADAERALGPLQMRGVTALHSGQRGFDKLVDRHQAALLSTRLPYGNGGPARHLQLDLEYHRNHQPYSFGIPYQAGRFWLDRNYVDTEHAHADRRYTRQALYWEHGLDDDLTLRAHMQRARATRNETLYGFFTTGGDNDTSLPGYYRELHEKYRQSDAGVRLDGQITHSAVRHRWSLAWLSHRQARDFIGPQNIAGFSIDLDAPIFPAHPELLPLSERYNIQNYRERGLGAAWQTHWQGWDMRLGARKSSLTMNSSLHPDIPLARVADAEPFTHAFALGRELGAQQRIWLSRTQAFLPNRGQMASGAWLPASKSVQWEAGWQWQTATGVDGIAPRHRPQLSLTLFDIEQSNLPAVDPQDRDFFILRGDVRSRGIELGAQSHTGPLEWAIAATFIDARVTPGAGRATREISGVASRSGMVQVAWPRTDGSRWWARMVAVGARPGDGTGSFHAPGYGVVSLGLEQPLRATHDLDLRLGMRIDNVGDRQYARALTGADNVWPGNGRRAALWLSAHW